MRVSLDPNSTQFAKQVAGLRQRLNSETVNSANGQGAVSARMMLPVLVPFLTVMRTELRDEVVPEQVMTGAADLLANIAMTTVQSLIEADPLKEGEIVEQLLTQATHIACRAIAEAAEAKRVQAVDPARPSADRTVIHLPPNAKTKGE